MNKDNPQEPVICLIDKITPASIEHGTQYMTITGVDGRTHKISEKRQELWELVRNLERNTPIIVVYETFTKGTEHIQYVADVKLVADELEKRAIANLASRYADTVNEERNRSTSLSYAKDLVLGDKISLDEYYKRATLNYLFIKGDLTE